MCYTIYKFFLFLGFWKSFFIIIYIILYIIFIFRLFSIKKLNNFNNFLDKIFFKEIFIGLTILVILYVTFVDIGSVPPTIFL